MRRWCTQRVILSVDHEPLQYITIYPIENNKVDVKKEQEYSYKRMLLIPENEDYTIKGDMTI